jgi:hypothetical protein
MEEAKRQLDDFVTRALRNSVQEETVRRLTSFRIFSKGCRKGFKEQREKSFGLVICRLFLLFVKNLICSFESSNTCIPAGMGTGAYETALVCKRKSQAKACVS